MQTFAEWLDVQLEERGWSAADLTRASQTADLPRGFNSGLISKWRRPPPFGVVPTQAQTLTRLARAFSVPESEVYRAAGLAPADATLDYDAIDDADLSARRFVGALRDVPRQFWTEVLNASVALANAYGRIPGDAPVGSAELTAHTEADASVSDTPVPPVRKRSVPPNKRRPRGNDPLAHLQLVGAV